MVVLWSLLVLKTEVLGQKWQEVVKISFLLERIMDHLPSLKTWLAVKGTITLVSCAHDEYPKLTLNYCVVLVSLLTNDLLITQIKRNMANDLLWVT